MTVATSLHHLRRLGAVWALAAVSLTGISRAQAQQAPALQYPGTSYSQNLQKLAKEFNAASKAPIVMMDRDLLALNLALRHIDPFDPPARAQLIAEMAKAETGADIDPKRFQMATYQMTGERPSTWAPGYGPSADMPGTGFCTVFGQDPDTDGPSQARELTNLNGVFDPLGAHLINPLSRQVINAYTDYHELGHCFYYFHPPAKDADRDTVHFMLHKNEMFGDVFASLLLARDGVTDFAQRYGRVRLVASALAGIDDEYHHATWDGLEAAQREIDRRGANGMKKLSISDIAKLAARLTEENAIDIQTERAVAAFQESQYDEATLKAQAASNPTLQNSVDYALRLKARMTEALEETADLRDVGPAGLKPLELVQYYKTHEQESADEADGLTYKDRLVRLRNTLLKDAGAHPDAASLTRAFTVRKEALRESLDNGDEPHRRDAMHDLLLMESAFGQALKAIQPKAAAKP